jgi:hypothetical protein
LKLTWTAPHPVIEAYPSIKFTVSVWKNGTIVDGYGSGLGATMAVNVTGWSTVQSGLVSGVEDTMVVLLDTFTVCVTVFEVLGTR